MFVIWDLIFGIFIKTVEYLLLITIWVIWCALHSALISVTVTERLRRPLSKFFRYYRLLYNLFALVSLLPVLMFADSLKGAPLVAWEGSWRWVPVVFATAALFFFVAGARRYDLLQFIGVRQVRSENNCSVLTEDCSLDTRGILSMVRHPWYTGALLLVWVRPLDLTAILTNLVLCAYLVIGAVLEERKLKMLFGAQYEVYQQQVSMFFPFNWVLQNIGVKKVRSNLKKRRKA